MSVLSFMPWYYFPVMALGVALPLFFVIRLVLGGAERRRILARGIPAQAQVMRIWETGTRVNDSPQVGFQLTVYPNGGQPYVVETTMIVSQLAIPRIQPGATLVVKVDPADPRKVAIEM